MKRVVLVTIGLLLLVGLFVIVDYQETGRRGETRVIDPTVLSPLEQKPEKKSIYIVGNYASLTYDAAFASRGQMDAMGWGAYLSYYFDTGLVRIRNYSTDSDSSMTFTKKSNYEKMCDKITSGDYLLIQFGNVDSGDNLALSTDPNIPYDAVDESCLGENGLYSFAGALYYKYIKVALDRGAIPILISPTALRNPTSGLAMTNTFAEHTRAMEALAQSTGVLYIDLVEKAEALYAALVAEGGKTATEKLYSFTDESRTKYGVTRLSHYGAYTFAGLVVEDVKAKVPALAERLLETPKEFK